MQTKPQSLFPGWGPQPGPAPPRQRGCLVVLVVMTVGGWLIFSYLVVLGAYLDSNRSDPHAGRHATILYLCGLGVVGAVALRVRASVTARRRRRSVRGQSHLLPQRLARARDPLGAVREQAATRGGGAFVGFSADGRADWVSAHPEHAVLVLGPPRSGKSSAVVIPGVVAHPGPVVSTSTKPEVLVATAAARSFGGTVWLFDPTGEELPPPGVRALRWSPVSAARTWDGALGMARAMTTAAGSIMRGTGEESHWAGRAIALLAPLLHAAATGGLSIADVRRWVQRADLDRAGLLLENAGAEAAVDVLFRIADTHDRERSSIFSTVANVLAAYDADGARRVASEPNFDGTAFVQSTDTVFVTSPAHRQALSAPLVVGLLEEIRHAAYTRSREAAIAGCRVWPPVLFALDECANIAPIADLPALVSEAGGQGLQVVACFQDLSQVRARWGHDVADGFLSLFGAKVVLRDIADPRTLEALSVAFGEYDRAMASYSRGQGRSTTYSTQRQRVLPPGDIANIPPGFALFVQGVRWALVQLTPHYGINPWPAVLEAAGKGHSR